MATNRTSSRLAAQTLKRSASPQEDLSAAIPLPVLPVVKSEAIVEAIEPPKKRRRTTKAKAKAETDEELEDKPTKKARKTKADAEDATAAPDDEGKPAKKPRKKKTDLPESFPVRDKGESKKYIGSHCSAAGGVEFSPVNAHKVTAHAFALFLRNQKQWAAKPMADSNVGLFAARCSGKTGKDDEVLADGKGFDRKKHVLPHGNYLVNLANPDADKWKKSYDCFLDELKRAEQLGVHLFNFHPGSTTGACTREEGIASIAKAINAAHKETSFVRILIENMAGKGNIIGGKFEDLAEIIALVDNKDRVGVCIDTAHTFAAGYDLRSAEAYQETMSQLDKIVGLKYVLAFHCNDSKADLGTNRDLHENIGMGHLGLRAFANLVSDERLDDLPFILETPMLDGTLDANGLGGAIWRNEIELLYRLETISKGCKPDEIQQKVDADEVVQRLFGAVKEVVLKNREEQEKAKEAKKAAKAEAKANGESPAKGKKGKGKKAKKEDVDDGSALSDLPDED